MEIRFWETWLYRMDSDERGNIRHGIGAFSV